MPEAGGSRSGSAGRPVVPPDEAALSAAFDAPEAPVAPPSSTLPSAVPQVDPRAEAQAALREQLHLAEKAIDAGQLDEADKAFGALASKIPQAAPEDRQSFHQLSVQLAAARKEAKPAREAAQAWLLSCGPLKPDGCRNKALAALERSSELTPKSPAVRERAKRLRSADQCLKTAEAGARSKAPPPPCLDEAAAAYRKMNDQLMIARVYLAKGLGLSSEPKKTAQAISLIEKAERTCRDPRCVSVRHKALASLRSMHLAANDLEKAARAALSESRLGAEELPPADRLYSWSEEADRVCARYDASAGAGSCRKLEKSLFGDYAFRDFSKQMAGEGLPSQTVKAVNEHYGVLLQECLGLEAERLVPPNSVTYSVRWMVTREGRVDQLVVGQKDQPEGSLATCLRRQFALWRYPRYEGEDQHVEQSFTVSARERRTYGSFRP